MKEYMEDVLLAVALAIVLLFMTGCQTMTKVADVPEPPVISVPNRPSIPVNTAPDVVVKTTMDYILQLEAALQKAVAALNIYRKNNGQP